MITMIVSSRRKDDLRDAAWSRLDRRGGEPCAD